MHSTGNVQISRKDFWSRLSQSQTQAHTPNTHARVKKADGFPTGIGMQQQLEAEVDKEQGEGVSLSLSLSLIHSHKLSLMCRC